MEKKIELGSEANVDVLLKDGKVILVAKYDGKETDAELSVSVSVDMLLDKLAAKIPGQIDDAVIGLLKAALKVA